MRKGRHHRSLGEQLPDRFTLVESEGRDVHEADDVRRVPAERADDLATVRVACDDGRAVLTIEDLPEPCDVVRQGGQRHCGAVTW